MTQLSKAVYWTGQSMPHITQSILLQSIEYPYLSSDITQ